MTASPKAPEDRRFGALRIIPLTLRMRYQLLYSEWDMPSSADGEEWRSSLKKNLLMACCALLLIYLLPLALPARTAARAEEPAATLPALPTEAFPSPAPQDPAPEDDASAPLPVHTLRLLAGAEVLELPLEDYLVGVVAAEMPASFPAEALKAQAVAARSYALCQIVSGKHPDADLCADPCCCQAWRSEEQLRESWGEDAGEKLRAVREAVASTAGEYLSYEGEPALAVFHSSSAGSTEDCGAVWSPRPYLVSVSSPETARDVPGYLSELRCAPLDFRDAILSAYPEADFSGPEEAWIGPAALDGSGRVASQTLGGIEIPGKELRTLFSLRSTAFTLALEEGSFVFTVTGFGHGVGMSQYGAMVMAREGADYREILAHYYPGTRLAYTSLP